jgi:hypothetical protein
MTFFEKVKKDIRKGFKEGIYLVKESAIVVKKRAKKLSKEMKERSRLYELHSQVQREMTELGGRIYDLNSKRKNPMSDKKVLTIKSQRE